MCGPSGSGKSTLVQLLLGLREPTAGVIHVGGVPLAEVDRATWSAKVAFVLQEAALFSGTVAENIAFLRPEVTTEQIEEAAARAHVHADLVAIAEGYQTLVGDHGSRLSGGQRQRIAIAWALVGRPELLVLDEPTSSLDVRSKTLIRQTLAVLHGKVTIVVIAHRLSTLDVCDRIMVLQGGRLLAYDAPSVLAASSEFYREALQLSGLT